MTPVPDIRHPRAPARDLPPLPQREPERVIVKQPDIRHRPQAEKKE